VSLLGLKTFRHGVHPPEAKDDTKGMPIRQFPFAPLLVVPLVQHAGKPSLPVVREGQEVARGQRIAKPDGFMSVAMHAPASGVVRRIALAPGISGRMVPAVYIQPFPGSTQEVMEGRPCPLDATPDEIVAAPAVIEHVRKSLAGHNHANPGSSMRIARVVLMSEPPSIDGHELTDKGYINQRATLERRAALVERLYAEPPGGDVIVIG
jgi:hypothetical protein